MAKEVWSVGQLVAHLTSIVKKDTKAQALWVEGEISNFTHHASGHMYFTLKDESARMRVVFFARFARYLLFKPKNGDRVIIRGQLDVYDRDGQVQIRALEMRNSGLGDLFSKFQQLKEKLELQGVFAKQKLSLPVFPKTIGVITSPHGAAVRDIITTLGRRYPQVNILLYPVQVQGDIAAHEIACAIGHMNELAEADVLIVGRGGGSIEELWAFNEEIVVRSIAASTIPIISAIGHETDTTLSDFVADMRAATPTAAAELAVPDIGELQKKVTDLLIRLQVVPAQRIKQQREQLNQLITRPVFKQPGGRLVGIRERHNFLTVQLSKAMRHMYDHLERQLERSNHALQYHQPQSKLAELQAKVGRLTREQKLLYTRQVEGKAKQFSELISHLDMLSPLHVMKRGYSLVYKLEKKELVKSSKDVNPGDLLAVQLAEGKLKCQVWKKED